MSEIGVEQDDLYIGYAYKKAITNPDKMQETLGTIIFVIDLPRIFEQSVTSSIKNAVAVNE